MKLEIRIEEIFASGEIRFSVSIDDPELASKPDVGAWLFEVAEVLGNHIRVEDIMPQIPEMLMQGPSRMDERAVRIEPKPTDPIARRGYPNTYRGAMAKASAHTFDERILNLTGQIPEDDAVSRCRGCGSKTRMGECTDRPEEPK
jgi:hypothetical protein